MEQEMGTLEGTDRARYKLYSAIRMQVGCNNLRLWLAHSRTKDQAYR